VLLRSRRLAAFGLWGLMLVAWACGVGIVVVGGSGLITGGGLFLPLIGFVFGTVGLLLALRAAENRMGWVFLSGGTLIAVYEAAHVYFYWGVVHDWPLVWLAGWLNFAIYMPAILTLIALPLLLFPTGKVPSRGWRWVMWIVVVFGSMSVAFSTIQPEFVDELDGRIPSDISTSYPVETIDGSLSVVVDNPIGFDSLSDTNPPPIFFLFSILLLAASFLGPTAAMVSRFRRSGGTVRHQIKWLAFSASIAAVGLGAFYIIQELSPDAPVLSVLVTIGLLGVLGIPIAAGIAITRYRLYDIDRLISRTISYTLVVVVLGLIYVAGALWLPTQLIGEQSSIYVAASTLAVAALFNPVRRRILNIVDRRFHRSHYDAQLVVEAFQTRLADRTDLEQLTHDSVEVVAQLMQPTTIGVWIRTQSPRP